MISKRTVVQENSVIRYELERKSVKNLNLRIRKDGTVYVSAAPSVPQARIDAFVASKANYIENAQKKFAEMAQYAPEPKQFVSGETFYLLGRSLQLNVQQSNKDKVTSDGIYLMLEVTDPSNFAKKQKLIKQYFDARCCAVFEEIMLEIYPVFQKYGVAIPKLRIREMQTRWGSCLTQKGIITLNKHLLEAPRSCIEYVVMHEFCHFIHPNHSKHFYALLTTLMPDWKERKTVLNYSAAFWL